MSTTSSSRKKRRTIAWSEGAWLRDDTQRIEHGILFCYFADVVISLQLSFLTKRLLLSSAALRDTEKAENAQRKTQRAER